MEEKLRYERALKRQNIDTRGSLNKVAQSSDVIVKRLEDGSVEGIKLQYQRTDVGRCGKYEHGFWITY